MSAIYQWFEPGGATVVVYTTTLYPVEVFEEMHFGMTLVSGEMHPVPLEELDFDIAPLGGTITDILLTTPIEDEGLIFSMGAFGGTITLILLATPTEDEALDFDIVPLGGTIDTLLIQTATQEEMHFGCSLILGSMTAV